MKILVTGAAGFIGSRIVEMLCDNGHQVVGIDNLNAYYDPTLKVARLARTGITLPSDGSVERLTPHTGPARTVDFPGYLPGVSVSSSLIPGYRFMRLDICNREALMELFAAERFDALINLAAQAGVRYSIENPAAYVETNIMGFLNLLECAKSHPVKHFVYASSSSVYGGNEKTPFSESDRVDNPVSVYAATKKSNELFASVYARMFGIPATALRFFTVYGPWGRPDMAPMLFADAIMAGRPIRVFNNGNLSRDFTYVDDIARGAVRVIETPPADRPHCEVYNIGCGHPIGLMDFIHTLEQALGRTARMEMLPMQPGDVYTTYADTSRLAEQFGYSPTTPLADGIAAFAAWFKTYCP